MRVLIVDDNVSHRLMLTTATSMAGYATTQAGSATEALDILKKDAHFDVILTDLRLPSISGLQLLDEIKAHYPYIPVIVISAYSRYEREKQVLEKGAFGYLPKPFHIPELTKMMGEATSLANRIQQPIPELSGLEKLAAATPQM
jgi:CheY-like chemotaxis protein